MKKVYKMEDFFDKTNVFVARDWDALVEGMNKIVGINDKFYNQVLEDKDSSVIRIILDKLGYAEYGRSLREFALYEIKKNSYVHDNYDVVNPLIIQGLCEAFQNFSKRSLEEKEFYLDADNENDEDDKYYHLNYIARSIYAFYNYGILFETVDLDIIEHDDFTLLLSLNRKEVNDLFYGAVNYVYEHLKETNKLDEEISVESLEKFDESVKIWLSKK